MSEDKIKTEKKNTSTWKTVGKAVLAVGGLVAVLLRSGQNNKNS